MNENIKQEMKKAEIFMAAWASKRLDMHVNDFKIVSERKGSVMFSGEADFSQNKVMREFLDKVNVTFQIASGTDTEPDKFHIWNVGIRFHHRDGGNNGWTHTSVFLLDRDSGSFIDVS